MLTKAEKKKSGLHIVLHHLKTLLFHFLHCNSIQMCWTRHYLRITFKTTLLESVKDDGHSFILTSSAPSVLWVRAFLNITSKPHGFAVICSNFPVSLLRDLMYHIVTATLTAYKQNTYGIQFSLVDPIAK